MRWLREVSRYGGGLAFDTAITIACAVSVVGLVFDVYMHSKFPEQTEGFLTPAHAVVVASWGFVSIVILMSLAGFPRHPEDRGRRPAFDRHDLLGSIGRRLPEGHAVTAWGAALYAIGLGFDGVWHTLRDVEANVEALFTPTHLLLLVGAALFRTGPLRSAWLRSDDPDAVSYRTRFGLVPALISAGYLLTSLMIFTMYAGPFGITAASARFQVQYGGAPTGTMTSVLDWVLVVGIAGVFLHTALLMAITLLLVDRWAQRIPFGSFTLMYGLTAAAIGWIRSQFLALDWQVLAVVAAATGFAADLLLHFRAGTKAPWWSYLRPTGTTHRRFRIFAFAVPVVLFTLYFGALWTTDGIFWSKKTWVGLIAIAGAVGYVISLLVLQPPWDMYVRPAAPTPSPAPAPADEVTQSLQSTQPSGVPIV